jgi:hypothetical protein
VNDRECLRRVLELLKLGQLSRAMNLIRAQLADKGAEPPCLE